MGSLYLDGYPSGFDTTNGSSAGSYSLQYKRKQTITIGDTVPSKTITWIRPDFMEIWVADRVILTKVSANTLVENGFGRGVTISIDGQRYACRMLHVGQKKGESNEWDDCLDIAGNADELWHWREHAFWGTERRDQDGKLQQYTRGGSGDAYRRRAYVAGAQYRALGFRPALVPLNEDKTPYGHPITLEGQAYVFGCARQKAVKGCFPYLWPVSSSKIGKKVVSDRGVFGGIPDGEKVSMYTLLMDNKPVRQDASVGYIQGSQLSITDQYYGPEYLINWVILGGRAVSEESVISHISNQDMIDMGLIERI